MVLSTYSVVLRTGTSSEKSARKFESTSTLAIPNKEKTICEVSSTYITKPGRFSKEQRVIVTLIFNKVDDGAYSAKVDDSIFHIVTEEKGGLKESWSGNLEEARERIQDVTELYLEAVNSLINKSPS